LVKAVARKSSFFEARRQKVGRRCEMTDGSVEVDCFVPRNALQWRRARINN
jgi:hypothetical protein